MHQAAFLLLQRIAVLAKFFDFQCRRIEHADHAPLRFQRWQVKSECAKVIVVDAYPHAAIPRRLEVVAPMTRKSQVIERLLNEPALIAEAGERACARAQKLYNWNCITDQYERLFAELAKQMVR